MRTRIGGLALAVAAALSLIPANTAIAAPEGVSPPGQIQVVTINAKQNRIFGADRFEALFELGRALRQRPQAFDSAGTGAITAPDVVIVQEIRASNLEVLERLLKQRFKASHYEIVGPTDAAANLIVNTTTVAVQGEVVTWPDVCVGPDSPGDERTSRNYQFARFTEIATGAPFVVAGIHLAKSYVSTGQPRCHERNIEELRRQLQNETVPVVIGGDFNKRAVEVEHECDPSEQSAPAEWWQMMTSSADGSSGYTDAVAEWHRSQLLDLRDEWTHEQKGSRPVCDGTMRVRRTRIDYLFAARALVAEAHTDHPGWAGQTPGSRHPTNYKYSDHRFVWGRFVIAGPPPPEPPTATPAAGGLIQVSWSPVEGVAEWILFRARDDRPYAIHARLPAETTTFDDTQTADGRVYRYAVAAVDGAGAQGRESAPTFAQADASGPLVTRVIPVPEASNIDVRSRIEVRFDEDVDPTSVDFTTIQVFLEGTRISGDVFQESSRLITFTPSRELRRNASYRVVVDPVRDALGNMGSRFEWRFST